MERNNESVYTRTEMMLGEEGLERLKGSHVAIFGVGGVGGFAAPRWVREGGFCAAEMGVRGGDFAPRRWVREGSEGASAAL